MRYRKLDANGDYSFGNSQLDFYINEPAAVGQSVKTRILLWLGEWYLNTLEGTPFVQGLLGKYSKAQADATLQDRILDTDNLTDISQFTSSVNPDTRAYSVAVSIDTAFGPTQVQVEDYATF